MIPRTEISSAPFDSTLGEVISLIKRFGHTRIPIHNDNIDEIIGILHAKDLLKLWGEDPSSKIPADILRKPYYVPKGRKINELLRDLQNKKTHLAIVTDEYGGTAGIITVEDILEEIVGEILDEHDTEEPLLTVIDQESLMVDARLEIEKLEEYLEMELPHGDYESVGGFIIHRIGRIPEINEKVPYEDLEFVVHKADQRKIYKILIKRKAQDVLSEKEMEAER
jgi:magnesium and cobalt transporter